MLGCDGGGGGGNKGGVIGARSDAIDDIAVLEGACLNFERRISDDGSRSGNGGGGEASNPFGGEEE